MRAVPLIDADLLIYNCCAGNKGNNDFIQMVEAAQNFIDWIEQMFEDNARIFLTGKDNFRYKVATIQPYKGNRANKPRPRHFKALREYLVDWHHAEVIDGFEADDALASLHTKDTVLVTYDKDLKQCPGYYFNTLKNELKLITQYEADFFFWCQMIIGDSSDFVKGIDGLGEKKAPKLLMDKDVKEMETIVKQLYNKQYGADGERAFNEIYQLLRLKTDIYK